MVATRLHQPWRAILSVLDRILTVKDSSWDTIRLLILQILWGIIHSANLDIALLIWDEFEWQTVDRSSRPSNMSKLLYTRFTKLIINHFLSCKKSIPRSQIDDAVVDMYAEWGHKLKGHVTLTVMQYSTLHVQTHQRKVPIDDADDSDMDLYDDNLQGDDDGAGFGASEVPLGTHVDVQETNVLLQEMFPDKNAHHKPSLPAKKIPYNATTPQPSSLQAKAKKLMQKANKNMMKINFKKAFA
ncbi:hypothetical protein Tco_0886457 [Tanacetum coccineum]